MTEITPSEGKVAFDLHQTILVLKRKMGMAFVAMGKLLKEIRDNEYFRVLDFDTFRSYVSNSELGFEYRTAYYYIEIYEWFVERFKYNPEELADIGYKKLCRLLPVVKRTESLPETKAINRVGLLVADIKELRAVDFNKKYKDGGKQKEFEDYLSPPEYFRCDCHKKWIIVVPKEDCCPDWLERFKKNADKKPADN